MPSEIILCEEIHVNEMKILEELSVFVITRNEISVGTLN